MLHVHLVFNACFKIGYCPHHFKKSVTVVLLKPNKDDYTKAKSYRPVALLNTLGKVLEAILAKRLSYLATEHTLLLRTHMGRQKGTFTDHACHYLLDQVYATWNTKKVASLLLLDVAGAFDNINQSRLIHNLRKRQVDHKLVQWIQSFLSGQTTIIKTRKHTTDPIFTPNGIPQGSPLSQILYLFYNADLLNKIAKRKNTSAIGYIDDIAILTIGKTTKETCKTLAEVHTNICEPWSQSHASKFGLSKYQLVHLTRQTSANTAEPVQLPYGHTICAQDYAKYLRLWLDRKL